MEGVPLLRGDRRDGTETAGHEVVDIAAGMDAPVACTVYDRMIMTRRVRRLIRTLFVIVRAIFQRSEVRNQMSEDGVSLGEKYLKM